MPFRDPEARRANNRAAYLRRREERIAYAKTWRAENREQSRKIAKDRRVNRPDRATAYALVKYALQTGRLVRQPCEICGSEAHVQAHHAFGYEGAAAVAVWWLCKPHHDGLHAAIREEVPHG